MTPPCPLTNSSALALLGAAVLLCAQLAAGCATNAHPCTQCAPIEGSYAVSFADTTPSGNCQNVSTPDGGVLQINRQGSVLSGSFPGWSDLAGTLYDTGDFTLAGSGDANPNSSVSMRATYLAAQRDGGSATLDGTWLETHPGSTSGGDCSISRSFTAARQ